MLDFWKNRYFKNLEKKNAKFIKEHLYCWYLQEKGTHEEKLNALWNSLEKIVLPPMTEDLKTTIIAYIKIRNERFEKIIEDSLTLDIAKRKRRNI